MTQEIKTTLRSIELTGTPYERGKKHGDVFSGEIAENLEIYLDVFEHNGADRESVYEQADEFLSLVKEENESYFEELQGVADGCEQSLREIGILNTRYEIMYSALADEAREQSDGMVDGCTGFGARPEITADGHTYLAQNWDWIPPLDIFIQDIRRPKESDKPNMVTMTEAGIVGGKIGVNEHGIGMLLNGLVTANDGEHPYRTPYHVRFREALNAERLDQAIAPFVQTNRACSANVMLGHEAGEIINLELAPEDANYLHPTDGLIVHANHLKGDGEIESNLEELFPDTLCRGPRLKRLLQKNQGELNPAMIKEALRDHFGRPRSICSHPDPDLPELDRLQTNGSFIIDLNSRSLRGTDGPPCESEYQQFKVAQ